MSWFAELAGKAENLLNNLDEQTGAALRNHTVKSKKHVCIQNDAIWAQTPKKRSVNSPYTKKSPGLNLSDSKPICPSSKPSPTSFHQPRTKSKEEQNVLRYRNRKSPFRKSSPHYSLQNCPDTLVRNVKNNNTDWDGYGLRQRRSSLPTDLELMNDDSLAYAFQNSEVENAMLKNELNVLNHEMSELLTRLRKTEDGNDVVSSSGELNETKNKLDVSELSKLKVNLDKDSLCSQLDHLKSKINEINSAERQYKARNEEIDSEMTILRNRNKDLEDRIAELNNTIKENNSSQIKMETELRHAHSAIKELEGNVKRSDEECRRLEKDWETYKLRVKNMLYAKDSEIKQLQNGVTLNENTKAMMEQIKTLKEEREDIFNMMSHIKAECGEMKESVVELEEKNNSAQRVVNALRDAMKDERSARNRAESQCIALGKELKNLEMETGQTIASLRTALRDKERELNHLQDTSSSVRTTDTSALNVADYDVTSESIDSEKIQYLTQTLVQKQTRLDSLMADNNMLKIQMEKLESKYKAEISSLRVQHSIVNLHDGECRSRSKNRQPIDSPLAVLSMRLGVFIRRYPIFRVLIIVYMIGLHLWVLTVLLTSTPEDVTRSRS